jgi:16S rRNA (cytosine1402-N4)-methyltransferase
MSAPHVPVMRSEALGALGLRPGGIYVDGTFGGGGYTSEILAAFPDIRVLAFDRDPSAIAGGAALQAGCGNRLSLIEAPFSEMADHVAELVDGVVLDIGVSSMQFDQAERGFSFRFDAPLDMRMGNHGTSAADLVNEASQDTLADILRLYGEERFAGPIARAIVRRRAVQPILTTGQLVAAIGEVLTQRQGEIHPATRTFQALRIAVNDELRELATALHAAERLLRPGGALVVVSFHSLEDRIVKQFFAGRSGRTVGSRHAPVQHLPATFGTIGKQPVLPEDSEAAQNPRARSARLRWAIRTADAPAPIDPAVMALAALPVRATARRRP